MFMREFKSIDSAVSVDLLRRRLKSEELEQYGEPFTPELVYEAIRSIPRFAHMKVRRPQKKTRCIGTRVDTCGLARSSARRPGIPWIPSRRAPRRVRARDAGCSRGWQLVSPFPCGIVQERVCRWSRLVGGRAPSAPGRHTFFGAFGCSHAHHQDVWWPVAL